MGKVEATLLLLSKEYGVFYFDAIRDGETVDSTENRINVLFSCIASCFRKSCHGCGNSELPEDMNLRRQSDAACCRARTSCSET